MVAYLLGDDEARPIGMEGLSTSANLANGNKSIAYPMARELEMAKAKPMYLSSTIVTR